MQIRIKILSKRGFVLSFSSNGACRQRKCATFKVSKKGKYFPITFFRSNNANRYKIGLI